MLSNQSSFNPRSGGVPSYLRPVGGGGGGQNDRPFSSKSKMDKDAKKGSIALSEYWVSRSKVYSCFVSQFLY